MMGMVWLGSVRFHVLMLLGYAALAAASPLDTAAYEGRRIADIQFSPPEQPLASDDLQEAVTVKKGAPLRMAEIRESMQRLFATGRYEDIQVDAEPSGDGVVVRFVT